VIDSPELAVRAKNALHDAVQGVSGVLECRLAHNVKSGLVRGICQGGT
jgi:hypothetical protein